MSAPVFIDLEKDLIRRKNINLDSWFVTGHFEADDNLFDFMLHQLIVDRKNGEPAILQSIVSLTEQKKGRFLGEEKIYPLPEVKVSETQFDLNAPNGSMSGNSTDIKVHAALPDVEIDFNIRNTGSALYNCGTGAYPALGDTVYQFALPHMEGSGTILTESKSHKIMGSCWFDRQWQDVGDYFWNGNWHWAWMGLQMANGDRISLWDVVDDDGQIKRTWATVLQPDGTHVIVDVEPLLTGASDYWKSSASGQRYPTRWNVRIPALDACLEVISSPKEQEIVSPIGINKYEGASSVRGVYRGQETTGFTYVEMVGKWT